MKVRKPKILIWLLVILISQPLISIASPLLSDDEEISESIVEHNLFKKRIISKEIVDLSIWHRNWKVRCYFKDKPNEKSAHIDTIEYLLILLKKEPEISRNLLSFSNQLNTTFCIDERDDETRGYYDFRYNILGIKEHLDIFEKLIIFVHEIRHISQFTRGYHNSLAFDINEIIRMNFAIEADVQAIVTLYAWRMKQLGTDEVWNALMGFEHYSDIAKQFEREINLSQNEARATNAAFVQWYKSEWRVDKYFKCSYSWYVDMLDETKLIQKYIKFPSHFFDKLCELPCGKNYNCHKSIEIKEKPRNILQKAKQYSTEVTSP